MSDYGDVFHGICLIVCQLQVVRIFHYFDVNCLSFNVREMTRDIIFLLVRNDGGPHKFY